MVGGIAHAGEARISGFYTAAPAGDPVVVTKQDGSSIAMFNLKGFVIVNDQSNPWHGAIMDCNGIGAYAADGSMQTMGGTCMLIDSDGDVQRLPWQATGPDGGTWEAAGGTGKYANMTGSGTYLDGPLPDGRLFNRWRFRQVTR
jgi:hypothetical protein